MAAAIPPAGGPGGDGMPPWKGRDGGDGYDSPVVDDDFEEMDEEEFWLRYCYRCKRYAYLRKGGCANPLCDTCLHYIWVDVSFLV